MMATPPNSPDLEQFTKQVLEDIPLLQHMQVKFSQYDGRCLRLDAPLAANKNDKHTAFGGSLASLATICGWSLVSLQTRTADLDCNVVVVESQIKYTAAATGDFNASADISPDRQRLFLHKLAQTGRSRLTLSVAIRQGEQAVAEFDGSYLARLK